MDKRVRRYRKKVIKIKYTWEGGSYWIKLLGQFLPSSTDLCQILPASLTNRAESCNPCREVQSDQKRVRNRKTATVAKTLAWQSQHWQVIGKIKLRKQKGQETFPHFQYRNTSGIKGYIYGKAGHLAKGRGHNNFPKGPSTAALKDPVGQKMTMSVKVHERQVVSLKDTETPKLIQKNKTFTSVYG